MNVVLCEGLEQIGSRAFSQCILLERCNIPSTVKQIKEDAFLDCPRLTAVTFCGEVEDLVTELSQRLASNVFVFGSMCHSGALGKNNSKEMEGLHS